MIQPGEFSLAHGGLLLADELPEWPRDARECLREPMERGRVTLTRKQGSLELPSAFTLAANGNLCPCGGWPTEIAPPFDETSTKTLPLCTCKAGLRRNYLARLSGPILDRIDIVQLVRGRPKTELRRNVSPTEVRARFEALRFKVEDTHKRCIEKWGKPPGLLSAVEAENFSSLIPERIRASSLRSRHKLIRLALTLSCWDKTSEPSAAHFSEASHYRAEELKIVA
jgi:magnesium chelatase family protein